MGASQSKIHSLPFELLCTVAKKKKKKKEICWLFRRWVLSLTGASENYKNYNSAALHL